MTSSDLAETGSPDAGSEDRAQPAKKPKAAPAVPMFAPAPGKDAIFAPAANFADFLFALAISALMLAVYLFRSPMWALPGDSAAVASVVAGIGPMPFAGFAPAVLAAKAFVPLAGGPGAAVAASSAVFSALACGAFFLLLLSLFHAYLKPALLVDDVRHGEFQAKFLPRFGAFAGALSWGVCPAMLRLASGQAPSATAVFAVAAALAVVLHAQVSDSFPAMAAGMFLAGAAAGVSPIGIHALVPAMASAVFLSIVTDSERNPAATIAAAAGAAALGAFVSAGAASAVFAASSARFGGGTGAARAFVRHVALLASATFGSTRTLGMDLATARLVPAVSVLPLAGWLFAARTSLSEREERVSLHVFNLAAFVVASVCLVGTGFSPLSAAAGLVPEAPAAALCASTVAYALVACYVQSLYFFSENVFPMQPISERRTGWALRWLSVAAAFSVAAAAAASSFRNAPTCASSLWKTLADGSLDSLCGRSTVKASPETAPLLRLRAAERGMQIGFFPGDLPFPSGAEDPAGVASDSDLGAWEDSGFEARPNGIMFVGVSPGAGPDLAAAAALWDGIASGARADIAAARRSGGETARRAAALLSARIAGSGGELVREAARSRNGAAAATILGRLRAFAPDSPLAALASVSLFGGSAPARDRTAVEAATRRGGPGLGGLAEMSIRESRPVDPAAEVFLAPGFVRLAAEERAIAVLERAEPRFADLTAEDRAIVISATARVRLLLGDREKARAGFERAAAVSGGADVQSAFALAEILAPPPEDDAAEAARAARLEAIGASPEAVLASRLRAMEARGIPVSARMVLDKAIRRDPRNPTLWLMRFERDLVALEAAADDDRRRHRETAVEDLDKLREDPGPWSVRIALGAARLWLLDGQSGLARAELASVAIAHPDERRVLFPLVALDGAIGMADARADHLAALRRIDPALADAAASADVSDPAVFGTLSLEEELFAAFPLDRRDAEFEGAAAVAGRDADAVHRALVRAFASASLPDAGEAR